MLNAMLVLLQDFGLNFEKDVFAVLADGSMFDFERIKKTEKQMMVCLSRELHRVVNRVIFIM